MKESVLANAVNDGTVQFPSKMENGKNYSVFVVIARDSGNFPKDYTGKWGITPENGTLFCEADQSVVEGQGGRFSVFIRKIGINELRFPEINIEILIW